MITSRPLSPQFLRFKFGVQYVGTKYCGWAECKDHPRLRSVEGVLRDAIAKFVGANNFENFKGSSRTDLGVHDVRNVFQVDLRLFAKRSISKHKNDKLPVCEGSTTGFSQTNHQFQNDMISTKAIESNDEAQSCKSSLRHEFVLGGINSKIDHNQNDLSITDVELVDSNFDARGNAVGRQYMYRILCPRKDVPISVLKALKYRKGVGLFHNDRAWIVPYPIDIEILQVWINLCSKMKY